MNNIDTIAEQLNIKQEQVAATVELLDDDNTVPFIARYRKEATGGLDEEQIRQIKAQLESLRALDERRQTVLKTIQEQDKLTPELRQEILAAETRTELEDLYQPYKPKRKTRASVARKKGLQPLADLIIEQIRTTESAEQVAAPFLRDSVTDSDAALAGARDIVAEAISDQAEIRQTTRKKALKWGRQITEKSADADDPRKVYEQYYQADLSVDRLRPHQILAINRAEREGVLRVNVAVAERDWRGAIRRHFRSDARSPLADHLDAAIDDAAKRLLLPAIERDVLRALTEQAEAHAIQVFAKNLRALLTQPPLSGHVVMGIDPGFRTGCKVAVVDPTGDPLEEATIYPHPPQSNSQAAAQTLASLIQRHAVTLIAIGNGTASRETEQLIAELIASAPDIELHYLIASEAGASVYSASKLARAELPEMDVSMRGAVSIARRVQDPLAELVKIDPRSLGVGMYQHDINQNALGEALDTVVESVVNQIGVDVNTASPALLQHIAGIGPTLAEKIVEHRQKHGPFEDREALLDVHGMGPKTFQQAAGFLRIMDGDNPLDRTAIHPESYPVAEAVISRAGLELDSGPEERQTSLEGLWRRVPPEALAAELGTGLPTLEDICKQLIHPGRDPREDLPKPILRSDVLSMDDLTQGMRLQGTVRNVVDFGAFIDIGVKQDGLLHRSKIPPGEQLQVGDILTVSILKVEKERGRISLGWS